MRVHSPNSHPIFDPRWADELIAKHFPAQISLADEMVKYGADLMMRAMGSAPQSRGHESIITVLFRQSLTAADSGFLALGRGAIDSASVHARRMLEIRWGLQLALRDPEKWGRHLHVSTLRENRHLARRSVPNTEEYTTFKEARTLTDAANPPTPDMIVAYERAIEATTDILSRAEFAHIDAGFDIGLKDLGYEPPWYYDGHEPKSKRIKSIRKLAIEVGARADYDTLYKFGSFSVHGTHEATHRLHKEGGVAVAPLRTPEGFREAYISLAALLVDAFRRVIEQYRNGELEQFIGRYETTWRQTIFSTPRVVVELGPKG